MIRKRFIPQLINKVDNMRSRSCLCEQVRAESLDAYKFEGTVLKPPGPRFPHHKILHSFLVDFVEDLAIQELEPPVPTIQRDSVGNIGKKEASLIKALFIPETRRRA